MTKKGTVVAVAVPEQKTSMSIENLLSQAIDKNVPVETLERLLAMRREFLAEQAKQIYNENMASFQSACPTIKKTKEVKTKSGIVAYRYAPIESIVEQIKPLLKEYGFSYSTQTETLEGKVKATVIVKHINGHSENYEMEVPLGNKTEIMSASQVVAAATTFAKRYAFCNAFGILTGDEDTDASPIIQGEITAKKQTAKQTPVQGEFTPAPQKRNYPLRPSNVQTFVKTCPVCGENFETDKTWCKECIKCYKKSPAEKEEIIKGRQNAKETAERNLDGQPFNS